MNNNRRKQLQEIIDQLETLKEELETIQEEEQECYDNLPASLQEGDKGEKMTSAIDNLDNAISSIEDVTSAIEEAKA